MMSCRRASNDGTTCLGRDGGWAFLGTASQTRGWQGLVVLHDLQVPLTAVPCHAKLPVSRTRKRQKRRVLHDREVWRRLSCERLCIPSLQELAFEPDTSNGENFIQPERQEWILIEDDNARIVQQLVDTRCLRDMFNMVCSRSGPTGFVRGYGRWMCSDHGRLRFQLLVQLVHFSAASLSLAHGKDAENRGAKQRQQEPSQAVHVSRVHVTLSSKIGTFPFVRWPWFPSTRSTGCSH